MNETKQSETPICDAAEFFAWSDGDNSKRAVVASSKARELELENRRLREELSNIETHLSVHEMRTHRPLHMDVLHLCGDAGQWKECAAKAVTAMNGTVKRLRLALAEAAGSECDIPDAPGALENIKAVAAANQTFDALNK